MTSRPTATDDRCSACAAPLADAEELLVRIAHGRRQPYCPTCGRAARARELPEQREPVTGAGAPDRSSPRRAGP